MAICLNAELDYVLLKVPNGEIYILAKRAGRERHARPRGIDYAACTVAGHHEGLRVRAA